MLNPLPTVPAAARLVLDVGCGDGARLPNGEHARIIGADIDFASLQLANGRAQVVASTGEELPFPANTFDLVSCCVSLPYMNIPIALAEMRRVLKPRASIWLLLHGWKRTMRRLRDAVLHLDFVDFCFALYLFANGLALHFGLPQFRFPFGSHRMESMQTSGGIRRALTAAGFSEIFIRRDKYFVVIATRN